MKEKCKISPTSRKKPYVQPGMRIVECKYASMVCASNEVPDFEEGEELIW